MTEKRFKCVSDYDWWGVIDTTGEIKGEYDNDCFSTYTVVDLLNKLNDECEFLEIENEALEDGATRYAELAHKSLKENEQLKKENKELKASLYAEKTNTAEVVNDYAKQFKRHSAQFSFMIDLAEDLGVDIKSLEALDD